VDAFLSDYLRFVHFFHRVDALRFLEGYAPDFAKATLADHELAVKVVAVYLFVVQGCFLLGLLLALQFGEVDLEAVFYLFGRLLGDGGVAAVVFLFLPCCDFLGFMDNCACGGRYSGITMGAEFPALFWKIPGVLSGEWRLCAACGFDFGFAVPVGIEEEGFVGGGHGDGVVDFLDEGVDDGGGGPARLFSDGGFALQFSAVGLTFHI
jgi:hypothetical protein